MKQFILKIFFFIITFILVIVIGIFLPVTPKAKNYLAFSKIKKDSLLQNVESPRIIFIGGSNLIYGLNSQMIKDSLEVNPINAGSAASVGLIYMMDNTSAYIKYGDIVIIAAEYQQFYGNFAYGSNDLFRVLMDVDRSDFLKLRINHWPNLLKPIPSYFLTKFDFNNYFNIDKNSVYGMNIFNEYGDSSLHWELEKQDFPPLNPIKNSFNYSLIEEIKTFEKKLYEKGAKLYITFPGVQSASFDINEAKITKVEQELMKSDFKILGNAERYKIPDSLIFNQAYHLTKKGVDLRTSLLINDILDRRQ